jgi:hypothetical protein
MFLARIVFFRLHESPRYLVHAGRPQEAIESLQMISRFNGSDLSLELEDVEDHHKPAIESPVQDNSISAPISLSRAGMPKAERPRLTSTTIFHSGQLDGETSPPPTATNGNGRPAFVPQYQSTQASPPQLDTHSFITPSEESPPATTPFDNKDTSGGKADSPTHSRSPSSSSPTYTRTPRPPRPSLSLRHSRRQSRRISSVYERKVCGSLPRWLRKPMWAWWDRVMMVLTPEWIRTTVLMWSTWFTMSLGSFWLNTRLNYC